MRVDPAIAPASEERGLLHRLVQSGLTDPRLALRARMVLMAADGLQNRAIAERLGVGRAQVARWRARYAQWGIAGIEDDVPPHPVAARGVAEAGADAAGGLPPAEWPPDTPAAAERALNPSASTRFMPPRGARQLMPREALMERLVDARRQRCVVVQGQAGSGKTSTLLAWRRILLSLDFDVAWLSLSPEDNELPRFFDGVLASIAEVDAGIARASALLAGRSDSGDAGIELWVIALVQGFGNRQREMVLMLDDLHHIDDARVLQALQWLLDYAPPHLHLAFSSRSPVPLLLERLRAQGQLTELGMRELRFSAEESERYLADQLGSMERHDAKALHELTDGWIAGLQLFALDLRGRRGAPHAPVQLRDAQAFSSYFEREMLGRLSAQELDLLTRSAVCSRICAPLVAALLAGAPPAAPIKARLDRLVDDNFFITQIGGHDREAWYRLHPLLRETLLARLALWPAAARRALHQAAQDWFAARGDIDDAVHHAVEAGDMERALAMVEGCARELLASGELNQLSSLLRRLPLQGIEARFDLHVVHTYVQMYARHFDGIGHSLQRMEQQRDTLDACQRYDIVLLRCAMAAQLDDPDTVAALLPQLLDIPENASEMARSGRSNVLCWLDLGEGRYAHVRQAFDDDRHDGGSPRSRLLGRCMHALGLAHQGQAGQAERMLREVLRASEQRGVAYVGLTYTAASLLAGILHEQGDAEAARALLAPRIALVERVALAEIALRARLVLADALWIAGRRSEAFACIDQLEAYAAAGGMDRVLAEALVVRMRRCLQQGEMDQGLAVLQRLDALAAGRAGDASSTGARTALAAQRARVEMLLQTRDFAAAAARLPALVDAFEQGGQELRAAQARLQSALAQRALGNLAAARAQLLAAVRIGHKLGLLRSMLDVSPEVPRLLDELFSGGGLDPVLEFYVRRVQAAAAPALPQAQPAGPARPAALAVLSEREYEVLALLAQAMPNKKIAKVLNVSPDTVKFHLKNIYGKLGVTARDEAVARLRDLGPPGAG